MPLFEGRHNAENKIIVIQERVDSIIVGAAEVCKEIAAKIAAKSSSPNRFLGHQGAENWKSNVGDLYLIPPGTTYGHDGNQNPVGYRIFMSAVKQARAKELFINKGNMKNMKKLFVSICMLCMIIPAFPQTSDTEKLFDKKHVKSTLEKVTMWQLANPKHDPRTWTNGALFTGIFAAWKTTKSKAIYKAMIEMGEAVKWMPGERWYFSDDLAICQTYIDLYRNEKRREMIQPTIDTVAKFMAKPYPVQDIEVIKWWWCDALFMAPPVLVKLGIITGNKEYLSKNDEFYKESYDLLYNREEQLFSRDLDYVIKNDGKDRYEANGKRIFWSRGNGWVMGGLVRILKELPKNYPQRPFYEQLFKEMAAKIASIQQSDGLWRASLLDPDSYPGGEVSGSGFFCYALAWGINARLLDKSAYLPVVEKAWIALNGCVNEEGRVGWVQPIGDQPRLNTNADSWELYGTGAFLLAGSEVIKLKR